MDVATSHRAHITDGASRVITEVEGVFGVIRKPLAARLRKHRDFLHAQIEAHPRDALAVYGVTPEQCTQTPLSCSAEVRDEAMVGFDALVEALEAGDRACIGQFVRRLMAAMTDGIALCAAAGAPGAKVDTRTVLAADTAFHLYRYVTEIVERVLASFAPRGPLAVRSAKV